MLCLAAGTLYRFDATSTATGAGTLTPDAGSGRWLSVVSGGASDFKDSVRVASTTNLVGTRTANVLLADANGAIGAMDGVTLVANDRILMKDQTTGADKGIYVITDLGGASSKWSMTRASDFDTSAKVTAGCLVPVSEGTLGGNKTWQLTTNDTITLNTTSLTFAAVGAAIGVATPQPIGTATAGASGNAADEAHVHAHGDQTGGLHAGTLHDAATTSVAGFMSAADKTILARLKVASKTVAYSALTDADMQQTVDFDAALPAGAVFLGAHANVTAIFDNVGDTASLTFDLGIKTGDTDAFIDGGSLNAVANVYTPAGVGLVAGGTGVLGFVGGVTPSIIFDSDVNLNTLTKGGATFYVHYLDLTAATT